MENRLNRKGDSDDNCEVVIPIRRNKKGSVFIEPVYVRKGDTVKWKAIDSDITLFFPDPKLFGETLGTVFRGRHKELKVLLGSRSKKGERYHYSVYHHELKDFGEGNSSPVIIIQR